MFLAQLIVVVLIVQVIIRPLMAAWQFTRPPRMRVSFCVPEEWGIPYLEIQLTGSDGVKLNGWYIPPRNGATIILLHGLGGNRLAVSYHGETLVREGYGVLMFDLRAHGRSGGDIFPRDEQIVDDVLAAVAYLTRQPEYQGRIGVMGISVGGMMAIQAAARSVAIRAVAADGAMLGSLDDLPPPADLLDRFYRYPLERYYQAATQRFSPGSSRPMSSNIAALRRLRGRPILLISTGKGFERRLTRHLFESAGHPKVWWEMPQAYHASGWVIEPEAYGQTMVDFFNRALGVNDPTGYLLHEPDGSPVASTSSAGTRSWADSPLKEEEAQTPARWMIIGDRSIKPVPATILSLGVILAGMIGVGLPFQWRWGAGTRGLSSGSPGVFLAGFVALVVLGWLFRQLILRISCRLAMKASPDQDNRTEPTLSCPCPVVLPAGTLRLILLLPILSLALLPGVVAILTGSWVLIVWSIWMTAMCSGDMVTLYTMRPVSADAYVRLHSGRPGCQLLSFQETDDE